jgi:hypothetical protein
MFNRGVSFLISTILVVSACQDGKLYDQNARLRSSSLDGAAAGQRTQSRRTSTCTAESMSCAPVNLEGRIHHGGAMLGELGKSAFNLTMLADDEETLLDPSKGKGGKTQFNLLTSELYSGKIWLPSAEEWPANPIISRVELNFDYVDVTVQLEGTTLDGMHTMRFVMVDETTVQDAAGTLYRGDKLYKEPGASVFNWCNATMCAPNRDSVADGLLVDARLASYDGSHVEGNPHYAPYAIGVRNVPTVSFDQASSAKNIWDFDFDLSAAVKFTRAPATFNSASDLVAAIGLAFEPGKDSDEEPADRIMVDLVLAPADAG